MSRRSVGAVVAVLAGAAAAALGSQVPVFGAVPEGRTVTPAAAVVRLVCPGAVVEVGADGGTANAVTAVGSPRRTSGTPGGASSTTAPRTARLSDGPIVGTRASAPRLVSGGPTVVAAQSQVVTTGDATGFAASACRAPGTGAWFAAGATSTGRVQVLLLTNASRVAASVTTAVWTERGPVAGSTGAVQVPARSTRAVPVASLAPGAAAVALHVTSTGGLITASVEQRVVRGLESGGVDLSGATIAPATVQVIPGVRILHGSAVAAASGEQDSGDLAPVARVLVPGSADADVRVTAVGADGVAGGAAVARHVDAGTVTDIPLGGLTDGTFTVTMRSTRPLIAAVRAAVINAGVQATNTQATSAQAANGGSATASSGTEVGIDGATTAPVTGSGRGIDIAWFVAAPELGGATSVAVPDGPAALLSLTNPTTAAAHVTLAGATGTTVDVPAGRTIAVPVSDGVLTVAGTAGLRGALSWAGPGALAGLPLQPAAPAARAVHVTG
ncbi:DUF5719 family protein [uncultured Amnibacterium sp.]|uniref:DUF5719 family protein n=1 Tax=uncultured Amnibacterium sp. TaxID=1631851 RepID=UPI0035CCA88A